MVTWDPTLYLTWSEERGRPFVDLLARVGATDPGHVVDAGCGPGGLTRLLAQRWPAARVAGVDSSPEMVTAARAELADTDIEVELADVREWATRSGPVDVLVSNATLQWVPGHLELLPALVDRIRPGGWLAFQVPGNFDQPSHAVRRALADSPAYRAHTRGVAEPASHGAVVYLETLAGLGCTVDAWETTYLHVLHGPDPVFSWVSGTGARPTLEALEAAGLRADFEAELRPALAAAYPEGKDGVVLPFRRIFVVARVGER